MSSLQATVTSGLPSFQAMYSTKRVLPQPVGPLSIIGMRACHAASKSATSSATGRYHGAWSRRWAARGSAAFIGGSGRRGTGLESRGDLS